MSVLQSLQSYLKKTISCRKRPRDIQDSGLPHLVEPLTLQGCEQFVSCSQDITSSIEVAIRPFKRKLQKMAQIQEMGLEEVIERLTRIEAALKAGQALNGSPEDTNSEQRNGLIALGDCLFYTSRQISDPEALNILQERVDETLRAFGISRLPLDMVPFDDHCHEARETGYDPKQPNNWVLETLRPGYLYKGRLLRPAWVVVNQIEHPAQSLKQEAALV